MLDRTGWPFKMGLHGPIAAIAHPTDQPIFSCLFNNPAPEPDALHPAFNANPFCYDVRQIYTHSNSMMT
jgi:hypothetical protein